MEFSEWIGEVEVVVLRLATLAFLLITIWQIIRAKLAKDGHGPNSGDVGRLPPDHEAKNSRGDHGPDPPLPR